MHKTRIVLSALAQGETVQLDGQAYQLHGTLLHLVVAPCGCVPTDMLLSRFVSACEALSDHEALRLATRRALASATPPDFAGGAAAVLPPSSETPSC